MHYPILQGKKALVVGIANEHSIAYGCASAFANAGASLALTYLNEKAKKFTDPVADILKPEIYLPCSVVKEGQLEALFAEIEKKWGVLDIVLHSIAFAPMQDLQAPLHQSSREGFLEAMDISCHSLMRMAKLAAPLMSSGGAILTMSYYGSEKVVPNYNLMGPVKAALESSVRYMAAELGEKGIRVHAISPGPLKTRAASGLNNFDDLLQAAARKAPLHTLVDIHDVGAATAFLASPYARHITGETIYVDAGYHIMG